MLSAFRRKVNRAASAPRMPREDFEREVKAIWPEVSHEHLSYGMINAAWLMHQSFGTSPSAAAAGLAEHIKHRK